MQQYAVMTLSKQGIVLDGAIWKDKLTWSTWLVFDTFKEAQEACLSVSNRVVEYHSPAWNNLLESVVLG